jgi:hypothetical protein
MGEKLLYRLSIIPGVGALEGINSEDTSQYGLAALRTILTLVGLAQAGLSLGGLGLIIVAF